MWGNNGFILLRNPENRLLLRMFVAYNGLVMFKRSVRSRITDFLYDHSKLKGTLNWGYAVLLCTLSALIFTIGYKFFLVPRDLITQADHYRLVSGGASGVSQTVIMALELIPGSFSDLISENEDFVYSILYFAINVPIVILAWFGIGKRFTIITLLNIVEISLFTNLLSIEVIEDTIISPISKFVDLFGGGLLSRAIFAGVCTGLSSALTFKVDASSGGIDVISYYIALKKSTLVGKYSAYLNGGILIVYTILSATKVGWGELASLEIVSSALFSIIYLIVTMVVIDMINLRNKKMKVEVVTDKPELVHVLMANIPHGATIIHGEGAFSGQQKTIIEMVISSYEVNQTVKIIRETDPATFVQVTELKQVYGHFYIKPIK